MTDQTSQPEPKEEPKEPVLCDLMWPNIAMRYMGHVPLRIISSMDKSNKFNMTYVWSAEVAEDIASFKRGVVTDDFEIVRKFEKIFLEWKNNLREQIALQRESEK